MEGFERCSQSHSRKYDWLGPDLMKNTQGRYILILLVVWAIALKQIGRAIANRYRSQTHEKYTRTVYLHITGSGHYVHPSWAQPSYIYLLLITSCVEVIIIFICSTVKRATLPPMIRCM